MNIAVGTFEEGDGETRVFKPEKVRNERKRRNRCDMYLFSQLAQLTSNQCDDCDAYCCPTHTSSLIVTKSVKCTHCLPPDEPFRRKDPSVSGIGNSEIIVNNMYS